MHYYTIFHSAAFYLQGVPNRLHVLYPDFSIDDSLQYNSIRIHETFGLILKTESRRLRECLIPRKRYFISAGYSIPLEL
jgi:hypothetical protein